MWLELPSWDVNTNKNLYPTAQQIVLTLLNDHNITNVTLYAFISLSDVTTKQLIINNNQVLFDVIDRISIVQLSNRTNLISDVF